MPMQDRVTPTPTPPAPAEPKPKSKSKTFWGIVGTAVAFIAFLATYDGTWPNLEDGLQTEDLIVLFGLATWALKEWGHRAAVRPVK